MATTELWVGYNYSLSVKEEYPIVGGRFSPVENSFLGGFLSLHKRKELPCIVSGAASSLWWGHNEDTWPEITVSI